LELDILEVVLVSLKETVSGEGIVGGSWCLYALELWIKLAVTRNKSLS